MPRWNKKQHNNHFLSGHIISTLLTLYNQTVEMKIMIKNGARIIITFVIAFMILYVEMNAEDFR